MGQVFGFEQGTTALLTAEGFALINGPSIAAAQHIDFSGYGGSYCFRHSSNVQGLLFPILTITPRGVSFSLYLPPGGTTRSDISFYKSGAREFVVRIRADLFVELWRGDTATLLATSASALLSGLHWFDIELDVANSGGVCNFYKDLESTAFVTYSGDTQQTNAGWEQIAIGAIFGGGGAGDYDWDDFYFWTAAEGRPKAGSLNAEVFCFPLVANADTIIELTRSTGSNSWDNVDEIPGTSTAYNEATAAGQEDRYGMTTLPFTPLAILQVKAMALVARDGTMTTWTPKIESGGTVVTGSAVTIGGTATYRYITVDYTVDPNTSAAWTKTALDAINVGGEFN